jgi:hypothetical protein
MDQPEVSDKLPSHKDVSSTPCHGPAKVSDKLYHHIKLYQVHLAMDLPKVSDKLYHHIKLYQVHIAMDLPKVSDKLYHHIKMYQVHLAMDVNCIGRCKYHDAPINNGPLNKN